VKTTPAPPPEAPDRPSGPHCRRFATDLRQPPGHCSSEPAPSERATRSTIAHATANGARLGLSSNRHPALAPNGRRAHSAGEPASAPHARAVATADCEACGPRGPARPPPPGAPMRPRQKRPRAGTRDRVAARALHRPGPPASGRAPQALDGRLREPALQLRHPRVRATRNVALPPLSTRDQRAQRSRACAPVQRSKEHGS
jgi:hypothetical protein